MGADQQREPDEHHAQQHPQRDLRALRRAHPRRAERGHAVGDRLDAGHRRAAGGERLQDQHDPERGRRPDRAKARSDPGDRVGMKRPHDDHREDAHDEHRGRDHQQLGRLGDPEHVHRRQQRQPDQADEQQMMREAGEHTAETRRAGSQADRDGEHVVDEQRRRGEQRRNTAEIELRDGVGAAALGVRRDHLRVGDDQQRQHPGDHQRQRKREAERARSGRDQHQHHRLGAVGDTRQGVEAERRDPPSDAELVPFVGVLSRPPMLGQRGSALSGHTRRAHRGPTGAVLRSGSGRLVA